MILSETRLRSIVQESINSFILTEDRGSRSKASAINDALEALGDKQEAVNFVNKVRNELELHNAAEAFIRGGVRMKLNNQYDDTTKDKLISVIHLIADKYLDQYKNDLNGLSAQELIAKHFPEVQTMRGDVRNKLKQNKYDGKSDYQIVRINSFEQAQEYGEYVQWCITYDEGYYNSYTSNGLNQFYFCLKNGFERVPEEKGDGYPLDVYGLSMFAVRVNEDGDLIGCTTRWNLSDDRDQMAMDAEEISDVIKMPFYEVFKPNTEWRDEVNDVMQRLANGEDPKNVFDECDYLGDGFAMVRLKRKCNYINQNNEIISPDLWFDRCQRYFKSGFSEVKIGSKWNFIKTNGELLIKKPIEEWFDGCSSFRNGFGIVKKYGHYNFINQNGEILYKPNEPDQWFHYCNDYHYNNGIARVLLNNKWNFINQNGQLITELPTTDESIRGKWFDRNDYSKDGNGYVCVELNGEEFYVDINGRISKEAPQVSESLIRNAIRESVMNFIKMDMIR